MCSNILREYLKKNSLKYFLSVNTVLKCFVSWCRFGQSDALIKNKEQEILVLHSKRQSCNLAHSRNCLLYLTFFHSYAQYYVGWLKWSCCLFPKRHRLTTIKKRRSIRRSWWPHSKLQSCMFTLLYLTFCDDEEQYIFLNCSNL